MLNNIFDLNKINFFFSVQTPASIFDALTSIMICAIYQLAYISQKLFLCQEKKEILFNNNEST